MTRCEPLDGPWRRKAAVGHSPKLQQKGVPWVRGDRYPAITPLVGSPGQDPPRPGLLFNSWQNVHSCRGCSQHPGAISRTVMESLPSPVPLRNREAPSAPVRGFFSYGEAAPKDGLLLHLPNVKSPGREILDRGWLPQAEGRHASSSSCRLAQFQRLRGHGLLVVKAPPKSNRCCDDDGASQ